MLPPKRQLKKLGDKDIIEIIDGDRGSQYPKKEEFIIDGYCLFLNTSNVRQGFFDFSKKDFISKERDELLRKGKIEEGDIILTTRGTIGNCAYFKNTGYKNARINSGMVILRVNSSKLDPEFLQKIIISPLFINQTNKLSSGSAQPQLPIGTIKEIQIPLPPLPVQHKIVALLDEASAQITASKSAIQSQLDALDQLWQSSLSEIFENEEYELVKLGDMFIEPKKAEIKNRNDNEDCAFVPMADMNQEIMYFDSKQIKKIGEVRKGYTYFAENDVLLAKVTPCFENGKSGVAKDLINGIGFGSSEYYVLRANEKALPEILYYLISSKKFRIEGAKNMGGAVGLQRVKKERVNNFEFHLPDLATQNAIVSQLDDLSQNIASLRSQYTTQLQHFDDLRASILDQAFKGELVEG